MLSVTVLAGCMLAALLSAQEPKEPASKLAKEVRVDVRAGNFAVLFKPPADWKESKNRLLLDSRSWAAPVKEGYAPRMMVTFYRSGTALKVYAPDLKLRLSKLLDEFRLEKAEYTKIGGCDAWQAVIFFRQGALELRSLQTVVAVDGWKVSLTFTAEAAGFAKVEKLFRDSITSFRLAEKSAGAKGGSEGKAKKE